MNKALITFAVDGFEPLLDISKPGLAAYADRHGYTLIDDPPARLERPASWYKIPALHDALETHDEVLWVDCDVIVLDDSQDLADEVPADAWQAITRHHTGEGEVPSAGVWYLRPPMQPVLEQIWDLADLYLNHRWWEQAGLQHLLGYTPNSLPVGLDQPTGLYQRTHWLELEWNALALPGGTPDLSARLMHCAPGSSIDVRADVMRRLATLTTEEA